MRKMKLGGRIAWSYALLFLTLMTIFIIMLNITLRNENKYEFSDNRNEGIYSADI